ncbi:MAG: hypothetical protein JWM80_3696 [Cyanobacteria bacterium RYN_339]|nr:hypothetical protein [Cyanobacteria bacterium RYN_339]
MRPIYFALLALTACAPVALPPGPTPGVAQVAAAQAPAVPTPSRTPIWKDQVFLDFKAKRDAAKDDPRQITRLFITSFAHYEEDRAFALDLMSAVAADTLVHPDPACRSGQLFNPSQDVYWIAMDGHPSLPAGYFDAPANALVADAEAHVQLDEAATKVEAASATVALKLAGAASRPLKLVKQANGWRVSDVSAIVAAR